jgi:dihydropteroate synthase
MGILNVTPDSFYNKGRASELDDILADAKKMIADGATILDIGGMSTRPNAKEISIDEEIKRVIPIITTLRKMDSSILISIDTYRSEVAREAMKVGANIINDISGGELDAAIIDVAIEFNATYICMHMQGNPRTMQIEPKYDDVVQEIYSFFEQRINSFSKKGLGSIVLDVGFGFGKTIEHNYKLLKNLSSFNSLEKPILAGLSRKSMVYRPLNINAEQALNGTTALNMIALQQGIKILRVHDVKEAMECVKLMEHMR